MTDVRQSDNANLLHLAVEGGHTKFIKMALDTRVKKIHQDIWSQLARQENIDGFTPVQMATKRKMVAKFRKFGFGARNNDQDLLFLEESLGLRSM